MNYNCRNVNAAPILTIRVSSVVALTGSHGNLAQSANHSAMGGIPLGSSGRAVLRAFKVPSAIIAGAVCSSSLSFAHQRHRIKIEEHNMSTTITGTQLDEPSTFQTIMQTYEVHRTGDALHLSGWDLNTPYDHHTARTGWDTSRRRIPPYRERRVSRDNALRPAGRNGIERTFTFVMFTGISVMKVGRLVEHGQGLADAKSLDGWDALAGYDRTFDK